MNGRKVIDYVNRLLLMEASFLLRTTDLSIGAVSDRLHFSEQAAFSKFFTRPQGESPKKYRQRKVQLLQHFIRLHFLLCPLKEVG